MTIMGKNTTEMEGITDAEKGEILKFILDHETCHQNGTFSNVANGIVGDSNWNERFSRLFLSQNKSFTRCTGGGMGVGFFDSKSEIITSPLVLESTRNDDVMTSKNDILADLLIKKGEMCFELWIRPNRLLSTEDDMVGTIFTMGNMHSFNSTEEKENSCGHFSGFQLRQRGDSLEVEFNDNHFSLPCLTVVLPSQYYKLNKDEIAHVLICLSNRRQRLFVNGLLSHDDDHDHNFNTSSLTSSMFSLDFVLQFFMGQSADTSNQNGSSGIPLWSTVGKPWQGTIFYFAAYNYWLSDTEVKEKFAAGLPPSSPTPLNMNVTFQEDARYIPSLKGSSLSKENNTKIRLVYEDINEEVSKLHESYNVTQASRMNNAAKVFILSLPAGGSLYQLNGTPILYANTQIIDPSNEIIFVPPKDAYSEGGQAYTEFSYFVTDAYNQRTTHHSEDSIGIVTIYITAVNDPPLAIPGQVSLPSGFNHTSVLHLVGTDSDDEDTSLQAHISEFPKYGDLYHINESGSYGTKIDQPTSAANTTIYGGSVGYIYRAGEIPLLSTKFLAFDSFTFFVTDSSGAASTEEIFLVNITPSILSVPSKDENSEATVLEDDNNATSYLTIRGADISGMKRKIGFEILSLPRHGSLYYINLESIKTTISVGSVIDTMEPSPYLKGIQVHYISDPDFFTFPSTTASNQQLNTYNESFKYRTVAFGARESNEIVGYSVDCIQDIVVRNVNDSPTLVLPTEARTYRTFSSFLWKQNKKCHSSFNSISGVKVQNEKDCEKNLSIFGINVSDADRDIDYVRVDVNCSIGILSLNSDYIELADFTSCSKRKKSTWRCRGSGSGDNEMTFIAEPSNINKILMGLQYESFREGSDFISISIHDGVGGNCLTSDEHRSFSIRNPYSSSIHTGCTSVSGTIPINVVRFSRGTEYGKFRMSLPLQLLIACLGGSIILIYFGHKIAVRYDLYSKAMHLLGEICHSRAQRKSRQNASLKCFELFAKRGGSRKKSNTNECNNEKRESLQWVRHTDPSSGDHFYEERATRRVTWTAPSGGYIKAEDLNIDVGTSSEDNDEGSETISEDNNENITENVCQHKVTRVMVNATERVQVNERNCTNNEEVESLRWIQHTDPSTGDHFYEDTTTRRVTWTTPSGGYEKAEEIGAEEEMSHKDIDEETETVPEDTTDETNKTEVGNIKIEN